MDDIKTVCPQHATLAYRVDHLEREVAEQERCMNEYKRDIAAIKTTQALIQQSLKNLMWPILIMLGAVLVEVGKSLISFLSGGS